MAIATVSYPRSSRPAARTPASTRRAGGFLDRIFPRRRQPTLFHRCLAVHMAKAGTLSALR